MEHVCLIKLRTASLPPPRGGVISFQGSGGLRPPNQYKYVPSPLLGLTSSLDLLTTIRSTFTLGSCLCLSNPTAMPYQVRNRTRLANTEPTPSSAASSATLEHNEHEADEPPLNRGSGTNRLKRGLSGSIEEGAGEFHVLRTVTTDLICIRSVERHL
jgi:hypothetical protein